MAVIGVRLSVMFPLNDRGHSEHEVVIKAHISTKPVGSSTKYLVFSSSTTASVIKEGVSVERTP